MPDPRDPRGVRHALAAVLALSACAVLTGATSLLAVGEWVADAPTCVLERLGIRCDPLLRIRKPVSSTSTVSTSPSAPRLREDQGGCGRLAR
ncbi:transposase family protein [Streptomyces inhibens]|uniref:transposase family protein n=1 Tax=Streptomyces inhibens TaxID=2293571 RepID=UPI001EE743DC|nr:transposase family protein [Streptomyces inhibens]UKY47536.1 transposase family protein [Streptomyces inhibens]